MSSSATARLSAVHYPSARQDTAQSAHPLVSIGATADEELIARVGLGDQDALSQLFRRYARTIRSIGRRIFRGDAEADDLVQDVFLYIHRKWSLFDESKCSGRSWIFQVAYTQAFLRRRRLKAQGFYASGIQDANRELERWTSTGAEYDQSVEGLFGRNGWRKIQENLSGEQLETIRLHFFEGYTFAEIAERIGQSYANVRNHHYRGLEKVRKYLAENTLNRR